MPVTANHIYTDILTPMTSLIDERRYRRVILEVQNNTEKSPWRMSQQYYWRVFEHTHNFKAKMRKKSLSPLWY